MNDNSLITLSSTIQIKIMETTNPIYFKKLSDRASSPIRATQNAAGFDLTSSKPCIVYPNEIKSIPTDLSFLFPPGSYGRIATRSGLALQGVVTFGKLYDLKC
jgi:dUTP pyrophosphatase